MKRLTLAQSGRALAVKASDYPLRSEHYAGRAEIKIDGLTIRCEATHEAVSAIAQKYMHGAARCAYHSSHVNPGYPSLTRRKDADARLAALEAELVDA